MMTPRTGPSSVKPYAFALAATLACALVAPVAATAAPQLRHQLLVNGDFTLFGNTLARDCATTGTPAVVAPIVGTLNACGGSNNNRNDTGVDQFWLSNPGGSPPSAAAIDSTAATSAQSTAVLSIPTGAIVRYARVYWAAQVLGSVIVPDTTASLLTPSSSTPHALTADQSLLLLDPEGTGGDGNWYQSSADITTIVAALAEPRGAYTVSGVESRPLPSVTNETTFSAWWIVVFYEDPSDINLRQLTLFDGLDYVQDATGATATLGGFLVPNGGFDAKLGVVAYEGDATVTGDALAFKGYKSTGAVPTVLTTLTDALNPADNFFNGTRSWFGAARTVAGDLPQYSGAARSMQGFDIDVVDLKALSAIASGDDSAVIKATSSGDRFALGAFITSINTLKPSFVTTRKTAVNLDRAEGAFAGDRIEYTIDTSNTGNDPSVQTRLVDPLPAGVTFVAGSLQISIGANAGFKTDAALDDQGEYDAATRTITVRLGAGASGDPAAYPGGVMQIGDTAQVKFRVTIDAGASGTLQNQATVVAAGQNGEPAHDFVSSPPVGTGPTDVPVDQCLTDVSCGGATPACYTAPVPNVCVGCTGDSYCSGLTPVCNLAAHACVGLSSIAPATQQKTTVAGTAAPFPMTLTNRLAAADTYDLDVTDSGCGWGVELWTSGGTLVGTRAVSGTWTIASGGDTNSNGLPDLGATAGNGATTDFVLRLTPPGGTAIGQHCDASLLATGATSAMTATAGATLHVGAAATFTPDYTGASAKAVSRGGDVGFPGVVQNNQGSALSFTLAATVTATPAAGTLAPYAFYSDPNGDGDWSDGAVITSTGSIPAWGGQLHVVLVQRASTSTGTPLATGTVLDLTATATNGATVATQVSQARVQYAAMYEDAGRTMVQGHFAPCQTIYLGAKLLPSGFPFALEWYAKASPVRGTDSPYRTVDPWPVSGGTGTDQIVAPADALGTWTVLVVQKNATDVVVDTITFTVERHGSFLSLAVAPRIAMADGLSVSSQVWNENLFATFANSAIAYVVTDDALYMDGAGAFGAAPALAHTTSSLTVAAGANGSDAWAMGSPAWPAPGHYRVDAEWRVQCGATPIIANATAPFDVAPPSPTLTTPTSGATVETPTPTFGGTALPGASVTATIDGGTASVTTCGPVVADGSTGAFSCTLATSLAYGPHSATASQELGTVASDPSAVIPFTVAEAAVDPATVTLTPPAVIAAANAAAYVVGGTCTTGPSATSVAVTVGGVLATGPCTAGAFSVTIDVQAIPDGVAVLVSATQSTAGGEGATSTIVLKDTVAAAPVILFPTVNAQVASNPSIAGTAEPFGAVDVTIALTGAPVCTATADAAGNWGCGTSIVASATVEAVQTDAVGNVSAAASRSFTVAAGLPSVALDPLQVIHGANAAAFPVEGTCAVADGIVTVSVGTVVTTEACSAGGTFAATLNVTVLAEGQAVTVVASQTNVIGTGSDARTTPKDTVANPPFIESPAAGAPVAPNPSIAGTAEPYATVRVAEGATSLCTVTADAAGAWSCTTSLGLGSHTVSASQTDAAGNASAAAGRSFTVLGVPVVTLDPLPAVNAANSAAYVVIGACDATAGNVDVDVGGVVPLLPVPCTGSFFAQLDVSSLADSPTIQVIATQTNGSGPGTAIRTVAKDTEASAPVILSPAAAATVAPNPPVSGGAEPGAIVAVSEGALLCMATADPLGGWSCATSLGAGAHTVSAVQTDPHGNVSVAAARSFVIDSVPAVALDPPAVIYAGNVASYPVAGGCTGTTDVTVQVGSITALPVPCAAGRFATAVDASTVVDALVVTVSASQPNATGTGSDARATLKDTAADAPVVLGPTEGQEVATARPTFSGTAEPGAVVTVLVGGVEIGRVTADGVGAWSVTPSTALPSGANSATVTQLDPAGNTSGATVRTFQVDAGSMPTVDSPVAGAVVDFDLAIDFAGTAAPNAPVSVSVDGSEVGTATADGTGRWTLALPARTLPVGAHLVTATADGLTSSEQPFTVRLPSVELTGGGCGCEGGGGSGGWLALMLVVGAALRRAAIQRLASAPRTSFKGRAWRSRPRAGALKGR